MKKRFLSLLMALCLMLSLAPAAFAVDADTATNPITVTTETELKNAVGSNANYDLVTLGSDITLTSTLEIGHAVTLSGGASKHTLTYGGTETAGAVSINTPDPVVMDSLIVTVANASTRGIKLATTSPKFTFSNSVLNACFRGIWVETSCDADSVITVSNSTIQNNQIPEGKTYDTWSYLGDARGIALWDMNDSKVEVLNSSILGFGYSINLAGTLTNNIRDYNNTEIIVTNSTIKGWTAFNVWSARTIFTITNSTLKGINTSNGYWDGFATIVVNDDIYNYGWGGADANIFNIYGGTITCYRTGATSEQLFRVDNQGVTEVNFNQYDVDEWTVENVSIIDGTGDSEAVFYSGYEKTPDDWSTYMNAHVTGSENCTLTGYNGATLAFIPD